MTYKIEYYYPIRVYNSVVDNYQSINYQIDKVIDKVDFKMVDRWAPTHYISTDFEGNGEVDILKDLRLHKVKKIIDNHLRVYCSELNYPVRDYKLKTWFSLFKKGNYSHIHDHGKADISGVYYYKTTEKKGLCDGDIFFQPPFPYRECFNIDSHDINHTPQLGEILLFPGWFKHGVRTSISDHDRISLSFNIEFK